MGNKNSYISIDDKEQRKQIGQLGPFCGIDRMPHIDTYVKKTRTLYYLTPPDGVTGEDQILFIEGAIADYSALSDDFVRLSYKCLILSRLSHPFDFKDHNELYYPCTHIFHRDSPVENTIKNIVAKYGLFGCKLCSITTDALIKDWKTVIEEKEGFKSDGIITDDREEKRELYFGWSWIKEYNFEGIYKRDPHSTTSCNYLATITIDDVQYFVGLFSYSCDAMKARETKIKELGINLK